MTTTSGRLRRGDVVLVPFPFTDLSATKVRPAVVVSPDPQTTDVLLAFVSSQPTSTPHPTEIDIAVTDPDFPATGLRTGSRVLAHKLLVLHRSLLQRRLGRLSARLLGELDTRLTRAVGLPPARGR